MKKLHLIGKSLKHSISPFIHNRILSEFKIDAVYSNIELPDTEDLKEFIKMVKQDEDIVGFNVTIPYKEDILNFCSEISEDVAAIHAANTIKKEGNKLFAYNTDWIGFKRSLEDAGIDVKGKKILILGSGGAAKACIYGLYKMGVEEIFVANRTYEKAADLNEKFKGLISVKPIEWLNRYEFEYDIIINTTSVGMFPITFESPFDFSEYKKYNKPLFVYDMVYNPLKTKFLKEAEINKIKTENGLKMLIYQAIEAEKIWFEGISIGREFVEEIFYKCEEKIIGVHKMRGESR